MFMLMFFFIGVLGDLKVTKQTDKIWFSSGPPFDPSMPELEPDDI